MTTYIVGALAAPLYLLPKRGAQVGYLLPGALVTGERAEGECLHDNPLWVKLEVYVWVERLTLAREQAAALRGEYD